MNKGGKHFSRQTQTEVRDAKNLRSTIVYVDSVRTR